jgi:hypothetical protein
MGGKNRKHLMAGVRDRTPVRPRGRVKGRNEWRRLALIDTEKTTRRRQESLR